MRFLRRTEFDGIGASPSTTSSSTDDGSGLLGLGTGAGLGLGGLLGGTSTVAAEPSPNAALSSTSVDPNIPSAAPISVVSTTSAQPDTSAASTTSIAPATSAVLASSESISTTTPQVAPTSVAPTPESTTTAPQAQSSSTTFPVQQSSSAAAIVPAHSSSTDSTTVQVSGQASSSSIARQDFSTGPSSSASGQIVTLSSTDASSTFAFLSTITPSAAADLNNPTLATSIITSTTKTGSVPGVTTETTGSGIVVTETLKPSNGISAGTKAGVFIGAAAGGLIIAALILFLVRKFTRMSRIARAESPPPSPLLNASNPPLSPMPPLRIEVGMHQRMRSDDSDFWVSGKGSSINEKEVDGHGYPVPISPLPRLPEGQEMGAGVQRSNLGGKMGGFSFFPDGSLNSEGKEVVPREF